MYMRMKPLACPSCHSTLDQARGLKGHQPTVGDVGLCFYCAEVFELAEGRQLVRCNDDWIRNADDVVAARFAIIARNG